MDRSTLTWSALIAIALAALFLLTVDGTASSDPPGHARATLDTNGCVFLTVYEGKDLDSTFVLATPAPVMKAEEHGLRWLVQAQAGDGGYGAGTHARQDIRDPHAVSTDPATTAMVAMSLMRLGNLPDSGTYGHQLGRATEYLLVHVEKAPKDALNITDLQGTQIQAKLGANIDVALTAQYLSNLAAKLEDGSAFHLRVMRALNTCVGMIQRGQNSDGSQRGDGWAGVLQSSFSANALESAKAQGAAVDSTALELARDFQKANFDVTTGSALTERAAGVTLYAVSSSTRSSAKQAREAKERVQKAKREGRLKEDADMSVDALEEAGYSRSEAEKLNTAVQVYDAAKVQSQDANVVTGFGNNGGEEFLSFLQTGESLVIGKDDGWRSWYRQTTGRLVDIQNADGSWNGHHCITSPVFCTATALLILSINNDIEHLLAQGAVEYGR